MIEGLRAAAHQDVSGVALPELVMAWGRGWTASRRVPAPVAVPGGFRVDVGQRGHRVRHVLHTWDVEALTALDRHDAGPGTWIKVVGRTADLREALPARWTPGEPGYLMTAPLTPGADGPPAGYDLRVAADGAAVVATVLDAAGGTAASGRLGPGGGFGVVDQVETAPAHRRRGLGVAVMRALSDHAARDGMVAGVLLATEEGRRLYRRLGWVVRSEVAAAFVPEG